MAVAGRVVGRQTSNEEVLALLKQEQEQVRAQLKAHLEGGALNVGVNGIDSIEGIGGGSGAARFAAEANSGGGSALWPSGVGGNDGENADDGDGVDEGGPAGARRVAALGEPKGAEKAKHSVSGEGRTGSSTGKPTVSANAGAGESYTLKGKNSAVAKKVTTPAPFTSMEMDVLLRQHKADERERVRVLEEEQEAKRRQRKFRAALNATATDTHIRLSKGMDVNTAKKAALASKQEALNINTAQFKAKPYNGPGGEDWSAIQKRQQTERQQVRQVGISLVKGNRKVRCASKGYSSSFKGYSVRINPS